MLKKQEVWQVSSAHQEQLQEFSVKTLLVYMVIVGSIFGLIFLIK